MRSRPMIMLATVALLAVTVAIPAFAQEVKATGLERAQQASLKALDHANARAIEARGGELPPGLAKKEGKLTGRARAAAAIATAIDRGNGNGFGRGRSLEVLSTLLNGGSPAALEGQPSHGDKVSAMVQAHNELRKQSPADE